MFADVRGYTALTATTPPAVMADRITTLYRWAAAEVSRHHGFVNKFAGDAVMATFNATGTRVDHAREALEAALALSGKAALLELGVGIGISVGPAVVGPPTADGDVLVLGDGDEPRCAPANCGLGRRDRVERRGPPAGGRLADRARARGDAGSARTQRVRRPSACVAPACRRPNARAPLGAAEHLDAARKAGTERLLHRHVQVAERFELVCSGECSCVDGP